MLFEVFAISAAFFCGLAVRQFGLPPLVGFLGAGFVISGMGPSLGLPEKTGAILEHVAHLGVLMLLFTVGLKLKLKQIVEPQVVGGALLHFGLSILIFAPLAWLFFTDSWEVALLLGIALSFSSTVLAAKMLEAKRELGNFHGRTAIGILVVQDILALIVIAIFSGEIPNAGVFLLIGLPLLRPVLHRLLDLAGHDELMVLIGMFLSLVIGGYGFEQIGLSGEIGALVMGVMLSSHPRASELSGSLWSLKEIFLVGFFLTIGLSGMPDLEALLFAIGVGILLPLKGVLFFALLLLFRLRARTSFLTALSLTAYSEFGLIVANGLPVMQEWLVPMAIAVSVSFVVAAPLNRMAHPLYDRFEARLLPYERKTHHPDEQPAYLGDANILIFGMGRIGSAAYERLMEAGERPVGLDADTFKVEQHQEAGRNVIFADAEDGNFWAGVRLERIDGCILAMDDIEAKLIATKRLRKNGFSGPVIGHALFEDHQQQIVDAGADQTYLTMHEAGRGLARHAIRSLRGESALMPANTSETKTQ